MRAVAVYGAAGGAAPPADARSGPVDIGGVPVWCGQVRTEVPAFAPDDPAHARSVLLRVRAFSCNFRDRARVLKMARSGPAGSFYVIGSEFCAEVLAVGAEVADLAPGDRVVGDNAWPHAPGGGWAGGIPTNQASREHLVLRREKVALAPPSLGDAQAAAFSLGAQTAYSMVEKLDVRPGMRVLVTAARSNTSLFAIALLRRRGVEVCATTTSAGHERELAELGVSELFRVDPRGGSFGEHAELMASARRSAGFDRALDPFFDLHLERVLPLLAFGARYVTCGFWSQSPGDEMAMPAPDYAGALQGVMIKNVHLIGNCLGSSAHLAGALADHAAGGMPVPVDSVYGGGDAAGFLHRTYAARDRFGKVVYAYE